MTEQSTHAIQHMCANRCTPPTAPMGQQPRPCAHGAHSLSGRKWRQCWTPIRITHSSPGRDARNRKRQPLENKICVNSTFQSQGRQCPPRPDTHMNSPSSGCSFPARNAALQTSSWNTIMLNAFGVECQCCMSLRAINDLYMTLRLFVASVQYLANYIDGRISLGAECAPTMQTSN